MIKVFIFSLSVQSRDKGGIRMSGEGHPCDKSNMSFGYIAYFKYLEERA